MGHGNPVHGNEDDKGETIHLGRKPLGDFRTKTVPHVVSARERVPQKDQRDDLRAQGRREFRGRTTNEHRI